MDLSLPPFDPHRSNHMSGRLGCTSVSEWQAHGQPVSFKMSKGLKLDLPSPVLASSPVHHAGSPLLHWAICICWAICI